MNKAMLTILTLVWAITFATTNLFPIFMGNHSCRAYDDCDLESVNRNGTNLGQLIVQGGSYFLTSKSQMLKFLNRIEMAELTGVDYTELQRIIDLAIENMENARDVYQNIISIAKETPYNRGVLKKLRRFDYRAYQETHRLNRVIFSKVKRFLKRGNVTGAYIQIKSGMDGILENLYVIKASVDARVFPDISLLWRTNQAYAFSGLFGMHMAEVFMNL